ncbi:MAG TPA: hypothetical protein VNA89_09445 [Gemmatimonadaceae bacterium]|nr:hypothetical protein [Gemmatimonadaceae bacterium]
MRTMRPGVATLAGVLAGILAAPAAIAQAVDPYSPTIHFETGLINAPVAWVSPRSADAWLNTSGKHLPSFPGLDHSFVGRLNTNIALETHWLGRVSVGASAYSQNPEWGFFGRVLLLRDGDFGFLPGFAVGVRNVGPYEHEERFLIGHDITLKPDGEYGEVVVPQNDGFDTAPTFYAVATKNFMLGAADAQRMPSSFGLTVGWGNGLFSDDGGLGKDYNDRGTIAKGLFLGGRYIWHPTLNTSLSFLGENDAWDWNAGLVFDWRGIQAGVYGTELEEGGRDETGLSNYNYAKWNVSLGYAGNIIDISRGVLLRARITTLQREQQRLRIEIARRERRIRGLEVALGVAQQGELGTIERRRREIETSVQEERDAIRRAEERLRQIEGGQQPVPPVVRPPADTTRPPAAPIDSTARPPAGALRFLHLERK